MVFHRTTVICQRITAVRPSREAKIPGRPRKLESRIVAWFFRLTHPPSPTSSAPVVIVGFTEVVSGAHIDYA